MKSRKILAVILALCMMFAFAAACGDTGGGTPPPAATPDPTDPEDAETPETPEVPDDATAVEEVDIEDFPGIIAIVTNEVSQNEEEFRSAQALVDRFGSDKVIHRTWPARFTEEAEQMITILADIASIPGVGAIIINQSVPGTIAAIDRVRSMPGGEDIFIVACNPHEDPGDIMLRADLALDVDNPSIGYAFMAQAAKMGAETVAHYSFPRHMAMVALAERRDIMAAEAERLGINFVDLNAPDPMEEAGPPATMMHITQDLPRQVELLGVNTAFFGTNCAMQTPMQLAVVETGAIYPQPCCPSPYHGFPGTFGVADKIPTGEYDEDSEEIMALRNIVEVAEAVREEVAARNMTGRLSTWPVPGSMMWTTLGFMYSVEWLNGNVSQEIGVIDEAALVRLAGDYTESLYGERIELTFRLAEIDGVQFPRFYWGLMGYLTF